MCTTVIVSYNQLYTHSPPRVQSIALGTDQSTLLQKAHFASKLPDWIWLIVQVLNRRNRREYIKSNAAEGVSRSASIVVLA